MRRLSTKEFLPYAPDDVGRVRVNHDSPSCSGSSKSMVITRSDDDRIYAKCFRCGGWGVTGGTLSSVSSYAKTVAKVSTTTSVRSIYLPKDFTQDLMEMPVQVRSLLFKYELSGKDIADHGLGWSRYMERFIIPVYRNRELIGYQARYYGKDIEQPKYITRYKDDSDLWTYITSNNPVPIDGCVIVEDMFSAIRCSYDMDSVALLGVHASDSLIDFITDKHMNFLIFLDRDNIRVRKAEVDLRKRLTSMGKSVTIISNDKDPKEYSKKELRDILSLKI